MFEQKLQKWIIRQQQHLEVIRNRALGLFADYEQSVVADEEVAWLCEDITLRILPLQALWPIRSVQAATQLQIGYCENGMPWRDSCSRIRVVGGYFSGTLESEQMGDNLEFCIEVLGPILVFCLIYYYIIHIHA
jgi:hypothetical protein